MRLPTLIAFFLPFFVVASAFYTLGSKPTKDQERQLRNAGMLLNGEVLERPAVDVIQDFMNQEPRLVILGNSFANTNVGINSLVQQLGMKGRGARLSIPNTIGAHWYAMLKHRVFTERNEHPDVVLIVSDLQSALLTTPLSEGSMANLAAIAGGSDPLLEQKVDRVTNWWWSTVLEGRRRWRFNAVSMVKESSARVVHPRATTKRVRRLTNDAMDQVFHPSQLMRVERPMSAEPFAAIGLDLDQLPQPEHSFLEAIAELCYRHGARLVLVRNRESPMIAAGRGDVVPEAMVTKVRELIQPYGGELLDFHRLPMIAEQFDNIDHMTKEGSRRFTHVLAGALRDIGVPSTALLRPPVPQVEGHRGSELAHVRQSWIRLAGPVTWTFPGWHAPTTRIRAAFEGMVQISLDGRTLETTTQGGRSTLDIEVPTPTGEFRVQADGNGLITALAVGDGAPRMLVGHRTDILASKLDLLARPEVFDGEVYLEHLSPRFDDAPPAVQKARRPFQAGGQGTGVYEVARLGQISDLSTRRHTPRNARCSPVRVFEDGLPLNTPNVGCPEVKQLRTGRMCHGDKRVLFGASDMTNPAYNGRTYRLGLDPERRCDGGFWLYPGDVATLAVPAERLAEMRAGIGMVRIEAAFPMDRPKQITVEVLVDGKVVATAPVKKRGAQIPLHRVDPDQQLEVRLRHPGRGFVIVNRVVLEAPAQR